MVLSSEKAMSLKLSTKCFFILWLLICWAGVQGCADRKQDKVMRQYGVSFNNERLRLGLLPLPTNWVAVPLTGRNRLSWINPEYESGRRCRHAKTIQLKNERIISEDDEIFSGRIFKPNIPGYDKADQHEAVTIRARFDEDGRIREWECYHIAENARMISLDEAKRILSDWGFEVPRTEAERRHDNSK